MTTYNVTPTIGNIQAHVKELNANVCTNTFPSPNGLKGNHYASLYTEVGDCPILIYHYFDIEPVNSTFVETVLLSFS